MWGLMDLRKEVVMRAMLRDRGPWENLVRITKKFQLKIRIQVPMTVMKLRNKKLQRSQRIFPWRFRCQKIWKKKAAQGARLLGRVRARCLRMVVRHRIMKFRDLSLRALTMKVNRFRRLKQMMIITQLMMRVIKRRSSGRRSMKRSKKE